MVAKGCPHGKIWLSLSTAAVLFFVVNKAYVEHSVDNNTQECTSNLKTHTCTFNRERLAKFNEQKITFLFVCMCVCVCVNLELHVIPPPFFCYMCISSYVKILNIIGRLHNFT